MDKKPFQMKYAELLGEIKTFMNFHGKYSDFLTVSDFKLKETEISEEKINSDNLQSSVLTDFDKLPSEYPEFPASNSVIPESSVTVSNPYEEMENLRKEWGNCTRCKLADTRNKIVFGEGNASARLMFIGEGPGANEDRTGKPFVGRAGELLTKMIQAMGLSRDDVFIGNIVKCRPPGNRDPEPSEIISCIPVLYEQIKIIKPEVIVALGRVAAQTLLSEHTSLTKLRGKWLEWREGILVLATYHPAYLLRNPAKKREAWIDLKMVMEKLGLEEKR